MAVTKLWPVNSRFGLVIDYATNPEKTEKAKSKYSDADYQALRDVLAYAKDEEKTEQEFFCQGINCNVSHARDEFIQIKEQYGKMGGKQAYHGYMSFKDQDITPELAQKIGMEFANAVWGKRFQIVVTTHLNTHHLHCHFVINSISFKDGNRFNDEEKVWFKFHHIADQICKKYGVHTLDNPNRSNRSNYYHKLDKAGMPTPYTVMRQVIDDAIKQSHSLADFDYILTKMGYEHCLSQSRKYWSIKPKGKDRAIRLRSLGENYTNDRIIERIRENHGIPLEDFHKPTYYKPRQYLLITREDKIKKVGGLYGLYLLYCYKLGMLPSYKKQNPARLHYALRDDLMKLDELTAQVTLLSDHNIVTDEQLFSYQHSVEEEIKTLLADRTRLRNEIRKVNVTDETLSKAKNQISEITEKLKLLRKEVKLCKGIAERSGVIEQNLNQVLANEKIEQRKENNRYEQRR